MSIADPQQYSGYYPCLSRRRPEFNSRLRRFFLFVIVTDRNAQRLFLPSRDAGYKVRLTVEIILLLKMASPGRHELQIEAQIKKRIIPEALTPNDLDFYLRKTRRLELDNSQLIDELNKLRVRLRRSEDFELKHEALLADNAHAKLQIQARDKAVRELKSLNEKLAFSVEDRSGKNEEWGLEKRALLEEVEKWRLKAGENEMRRVADVAAERAKAELAVKREVALAKKDVEEKEDEYKFQIRQLKKIIHEKETVEGIIGSRVQKIRKEKDEEIARLSALVEDEKEQRARSIEEKNEEISRIKEKFQKMINFELENIKKNLEDQGEVFSIELNGLKEIIAIKNDEISKLLEEIKRQATEHKQNRDSLIAEIASLKQQIYKIQREGELQLYNLRQKLMEIQAADLRDLEKRYQELIDTLKADKAEIEGFLREKERLRQEERKDYERNLHELQDKVKERDQRISSLLDRIKQSGDLNTGQLKDLHASFHKIQIQKQNLSSEYQNNITFMTQQIAKLTSANDIKNTQIKKLHQELHEIKRKFDEELKAVEERSKQERKQLEEQRQRDRKERDRVADNFITAERQFKNTERRLVRQKQKQQREKNKLKFIVQQLQKDIERLNKYIRSLDQNLKNQYKKSQMNILDGDSSRRQGVSKLQKQQLELQTLKKIEVDEIKRKYDLDTTKVIQQNQKLKTDLLTKAIALQKAEAEVKRLDYQQRNIQKISREKLIDYEKKMATLNNEINLTQQLYKAFTDAKAKKK